MAGRLKRAENSPRIMSFDASAARDFRAKLAGLPEDCEVRGWLGGETPDTVDQFKDTLTVRIIYGLHPEGQRDFDPEIIHYEPDVVLDCERCKTDPCSMGAIALEAIRETQVEIKSYSTEV